MNTEEHEDLVQSEELAPAQVTVDSDTTEQAVDRALAAFMNTAVRRSPLARNTAAYNWFQENLPVLKKMLVKEIEA